MKIAQSSLVGILLCLGAVMICMAIPTFPQGTRVGVFEGNADIGINKNPGSAHYDAHKQEQ